MCFRYYDDSEAKELNKGGSEGKGDGGGSQAQGSGGGGGAGLHERFTHELIYSLLAPEFTSMIVGTSPHSSQTQNERETKQIPPDQPHQQSNNDDKKKAEKLVETPDGNISCVDGLVSAEVVAAGSSNNAYSETDMALLGKQCPSSSAGGGASSLVQEDVDEDSRMSVS